MSYWLPNFRRDEAWKEIANRKLTSEEIARECHDIRSRPWPEMTRLHMKNLYSKPLRCGLLFKRPTGEVDPVIQAQFNIGIGPSFYASPEAPKVSTFKTLEDLVTAGWVVD